MNSNMKRVMEIVSKKLGITSEELEAALSSGNTEQMLKNMNTADKEKLNKILSDKSATEKIMKSSTASDILKQMKK